MIQEDISFTPPNEQWLNSLLASKEYNNKSEIINELVRKARLKNEVEYIREVLIEAENSGFTTLTKEEMREKFKQDLRANGQL
jgi:antitoxin ParD1/3/4